MKIKTLDGGVGESEVKKRGKEARNKGRWVRKMTRKLARGLRGIDIWGSSAVSLSDELMPFSHPHCPPKRWKQKYFIE